VTIDARFAPAYRNRAEAKTMTNRPEDAIEDLSRAIAFDAKNLETLLLRAEAYVAANNGASALKDYNRILELDARSVAAFVGRGMAHAQVEAFDDAQSDLGKAIEIDPKYARAYAVRAWVYKQMQQLDLGIKDMERALKMEPVTADAYWAQGELAEARGDIELAVAAYTKALGVNVRHKPTLDALNRQGLIAMREETEITGAGLENWRVLQSGEQFVAVNDAFPNLRVPLEVLGKGRPQLIEWERKKAPFSGVGILRFTAGRLEVAAGATEDLESAAIIDVNAQALLGMPLNKKGSRTATWTWDENKLVVASAEGLTEEFLIRGGRILQAPVTGAPVASAGQKRPFGESQGKAGGGGSTPAWAPWAQPSAPPPQNRQASRPQKPKSLFEMLFGN
jgi:tetratricopeptide (TPR) repeat protein